MSLSSARTRANARTSNQSGFKPPRISIDLIARPSLAADLLLGWGQTTLLLGPPGSGKTSLMAGCYATLAAEGNKVGWLTLSAGDRDVATLRKRLSRACAVETEPSEELLPRLDAGYTLFIDSANALTEGAALDLLETFLLEIPSESRIIVSDLPLRSHALYDGRLRGVVRVMDPDCLRLSDSEASLLLGSGCSDSTAAHINRFVGGWVAGLRFFINHIKAGRPTLVGGQLQLPPEMADYYGDVVCRTVAPETLHILSQLAVVERFNAALLAALPDPPCDWQSVVNQIREGSLLYFTSEDRHWVGFTPSLAKYLRDNLQHTHPARCEQLQLASIDWLAAHGYRAEAVRLAVALPDHPTAAGLIEKVGALDVELDSNTQTSLANAVTPERAAELPSLFLAQTYQRIRQGMHACAQTEFDRAWQLTEGFTQLRGDSDPAEVVSWAKTMQIVLRASHDLPIDDEAIDGLNSEMQRHLAANPTLAGSIASVLIHACVDNLRYPQAAAVATAGLAAQPQPHANKAAMWIRLQQAAVMLGRNSVSEALACVDEAWRIARIDGFPDSYEILTSDMMRGVILYEDDQAEAAATLLMPALPHMRDINGWVRLYAESFMTAAAIAGEREGWEAAERIIRAGENFASERALPRLLVFMAITRLRELTRAGEWAAAKAVMESASLAELLLSKDETPYLQVQQLSARLASARLLLRLSRPQEALQILQQIDMPLLEKAENRQRFQFHSLMAKAKLALRHGPAACSHLQAAIDIARHGGLQRLLREYATDLLEVHDTYAATSRAVHAPTSRFIEQVLRPMQPAAIYPELSAKAPRVTAAGANLSPRESQIITLMAAGCINKEIAARLGISEGTVKTHRKKIHEKLGAASRSQAIERARALMII